MHIHIYIYIYIYSAQQVAGALVFGWHRFAIGTGALFSDVVFVSGVALALMLAFSLRTIRADTTCSLTAKR